MCPCPHLAERVSACMAAPVKAWRHGIAQLGSRGRLSEVQEVGVPGSRRADMLKGAGMLNGMYDCRLLCTKASSMRKRKHGSSTA